MARRYEMSARTAAMQQTREGILDAAEDQFGAGWYDEVTLGGIAKAAGVSQQTVVNHFGSKGELYLVGLRERFVPKVSGMRHDVVEGDVASVVEAVLREYESFGDGTIRNQVLAERVPELAEVMRGGRRFHEEFVRRVFAGRLDGLSAAERERRLRLLGIALDVRAWHQLRREHGLDVEETRRHLEELVTTLLPGETADGAGG